MPFRMLELFSGIGGWHQAFQGRGQVVAAYDINPAANATYALNHGLAPQAKELATLDPARLAAHQADTWVMSPPCQPFCRMGNRKGLEDRRSQAFLAVLRALELAPPERLVLENVEGFLGSEAHVRLEAVLARCGLRSLALRLCPTTFGIPNQRPRVYILATRRDLEPPAPPNILPGPLADHLDAEEDPTLYDPALLRHRPGLDLVYPGERRSACFIGGYGQRFVGSGSFLVTPKGIRRFSVQEVARLLGWPPGFRFPDTVPREMRYKLLGNGLSLPVARWVAEVVLSGSGDRS